jgi:hypothetical protein
MFQATDFHVQLALIASGKITPLLIHGRIVILSEVKAISKP